MNEYRNTSVLERTVKQETQLDDPIYVFWLVVPVKLYTSFDIYIKFFLVS
jgi:hypothetical protein